MNATRLDPFVEKQIIAYAAADPTTEQCGLVYGKAVVWITNRHPNPTEHFEMDDEELLDCYREFGHPDGVWHSHPNGNPTPSNADVMGAIPGVPYYIVAKDRVHIYDFSAR